MFVDIETDPSFRALYTLPDIETDPSFRALYTLPCAPLHYHIL